MGTQVGYTYWTSVLVILFIASTMFSQESVHKCTWYRDSLDQLSMIDFVVIPSDLRPYMLDTWVKSGAELSTDHQLDQVAGDEARQTRKVQVSSEGLLETFG